MVTFWECSASKNLTWSHLCEYMVYAAPKQHIVAGERFHWSREERCFQRERFSRAWFTPVSHRTRKQSRGRAGRCAQQTERNGGFGFQTKVKDRFLNQRRWTCWYSCRENMQVLSATDSLVLLFFLFSFWKACYLCCLPHVTLWRLSLFFLYYYYLIPQCLLNILLCISRYIIQHVMCPMPHLIRFC